MLAGLRTLVTGASGFLGANLVRALVAAGADVTALVRPASNVWRLRGLESSIRLVRIDLTQARQADLPSAVDVVFHLASAGVDQRMHDVAAMIESNVSGTLAALETATRLGARRFVHAGSSGEYGPGVLLQEDHPPAPTGEYGATKAAGTLLARAFGRRVGLPVVVLRPFSVFGPWEAAYRLIPHCVLRALDGQTIDIAGGQQTRDFVFVDDVIRGFVLAAESDAVAGETLNLCTGLSVSVRDVAGRIVTLCGAPDALIVAKRAHESTEMWQTSGDPARADRLLGWRAHTSLDEGLRRTIEWLRTGRRVYADLY
jgi:nucleoside-diphosphate-sugar epimerase